MRTLFLLFFLLFACAFALGQDYYCDCYSYIEVDTDTGAISAVAYSENDQCMDECYADVSMEFGDNNGEIYDSSDIDPYSGYAEVEYDGYVSLTDTYWEDSDHYVEGYDDYYDYFDDSATYQDSAYIYPLAPTGEYVGFLTYVNTTQGDFYQQLAHPYEPGAYNYTYVQEFSPYGGSNSCYWASSGLGGGSYPIVAGSRWEVADPRLPLLNDQWADDVIGFGGEAIHDVIQALGPANGVQFPCDYTVYQGMNWSYDSYFWMQYIGFPYNTLNQHINVDPNTVQVCKQDYNNAACGGVLPY